MSFEELQPRMFSFNSPFGACEQCHGIGYKLEMDPDLVIPDKNLSIADGAIATYRTHVDGWRRQQLGNVGRAYGFSILDPLHNRNHYLSYDNLDRMVSAQVGSDNYTYSFNSLGNIKKIIKNNASKKFIYSGSQAHAPSTIVDGSLGVDVYDVNELDTGIKNRTYEVFLLSEDNSSVIDVNFSMFFGDGSSFADNV